jgi:hypothetical protein
MKKQTAVEWLIEKWSIQGTLYSSDIFQAKEMEKQQLIDFHIEVMKQGLIDEGSKRWSDDYLPKIKETAESYYQEIFKSE